MLSNSREESLEVLYSKEYSKLEMKLKLDQA